VLRKLVMMRALMDEGVLPAKGSLDSNAFKFTTYPKLIKDLPVGLAATVKKTSPYALYMAMERAKTMTMLDLREMAAHVAELDKKVKTVQRQTLHCKIQRNLLKVHNIANE
jgi:hypothetical protein